MLYSWWGCRRNLKLITSQKMLRKPECFSIRILPCRYDSFILLRPSRIRRTNIARDYQLIGLDCIHAASCGNHSSDVGGTLHHHDLLLVLYIWGTSSQNEKGNRDKAKMLNVFDVSSVGQRSAHNRKAYFRSVDKRGNFSWQVPLPYFGLGRDETNFPLATSSLSEAGIEVIFEAKVIPSMVFFCVPTVKMGVTVAQPLFCLSHILLPLGWSHFDCDLYHPQVSFCQPKYPRHACMGAVRVSPHPGPLRVEKTTAVGARRPRQNTRRLGDRLLHGMQLG